MAVRGQLGWVVWAKSRSSAKNSVESLNLR
ncbi:MAG: hypothetical protein RL318_3147, partial [Fibrobacterota bacterium]